MTPPHSDQTQEVQFAEVASPKHPPHERLAVDDLRSVRVQITADLGQTSLLVREILELKQGSIIPLSKLAGEMTDIYVNGIPLARGEVVVIADAIHVRIGEILGLVEPDKDADDEA